MKFFLSCVLFKTKAYKVINFCSIRQFLILVLSSFLTIPAYSVEVHSSDFPPSSDISPVLTLGMPGQEVLISMADIESLPMFETSEMVHFDGPQGRFSGVWLIDLLKQYGLNDAPRLRFIAIDGYEVFITKENRDRKQYLMVTRLNGLPIPPNNLGPLLLIIPSDVGLASHLTESKNYWIWALNEILIQ
ncbi:hypothetical protein SAMN02745753_04615 [Marinomonas polaris DSM 16579]|uniref:Oxidoreductase molybdopterin-binding domain-containing protein n=1 Tax=Marinomonas polaris DSM 16579 TaxID=1122206 RepID=A0A1M5NBR0_9GAMM|nr:hypothetical protein [Marinomonas polaris]SHG86433.1 hypothetical protein SAMN02745753_04615 [Marinomonas polaris DSM 16579]